MATKAEKQALFTKVTGLTFDHEAITDPAKLAWLIPDGAMLQGDKTKNRKAQDTAAFMKAFNLEESSKIDVYDEEDTTESSSSSNI